MTHFTMSYDVYADITDPDSFLGGGIFSGKCQYCPNIYLNSATVLLLP